jgi:uncharacterized protein (TIGR00251 family)
MELNDAIKEGKIKIIAKPNSKETKIISYDFERKAFRIEVDAAPENNEANIEIIKFFTKLTKKKVKIKSGLTSKFKLIVLE